MHVIGCILCMQIVCNCGYSQFTDQDSYMNNKHLLLQVHHNNTYLPLDMFGELTLSKPCFTSYFLKLNVCLKYMTTCCWNKWDLWTTMDEFVIYGNSVVTYIGYVTGKLPVTYSALTSLTATNCQCSQQANVECDRFGSIPSERDNRETIVDFLKTTAIAKLPWRFVQTN